MSLESKIQRDIRLAMGKRKDIVLWRNNVGVAMHQPGQLAKPQRVTYGLCVGSSDLIGILKPSGRFVALEVKQPGEKPTADQKLFADLVIKCGGFHRVVSSVDDAMRAIDAALIQESI